MCSWEREKGRVLSLEKWERKRLRGLRRGEREGRKGGRFGAEEGQKRIREKGEGDSREKKLRKSENERG